jgi:hypothetical protein
MDVEKTPKEKELIDINRVMNNLLTKVADAITGPREDLIKNLIELQNILTDAKQIDKTSTYVLSEETVRKVNKALSLVNIPDEKSLKSIGLETPGPDKTFKLDEAAVPQTEEQAREKVNSLINESINETVKVINDVVEVNRFEEKLERDLPDFERDRAGKILADMLLTLLGRALKETSNVTFPESASEKELSEINLSLLGLRRDPVKDVNRLDRPASRALKVNEFSDDYQAVAIAERTIDDEKTESSTGIEDVEATSKSAFSVGQFPSLRNRNIPVTTVPDQEGLKPLDGYDQEAVLTPGAAAASDKIVEDISDDINTIQDFVKSEEPAGAAGAGADKVADDSDIGGLPGPAGRKWGHPRTWYSAWDPRGLPPNSIATANVSIGGVSTQDVQRQLGLPGNSGVAAAVGGTLSYFGITSGDIVRFANASRRYINTVANAFELTSQLTTVAAQGSVNKEQERLFYQNQLFNLMQTVLANRDEKVELTQEDIETDSDILTQAISERGKIKENELTQEDLPEQNQYIIRDPIAKTRGKTDGSEDTGRAEQFQVDETFFQDLFIKPSDLDNMKVTGDGTDEANKKTFSELHKQRTFQIVNTQAKGTGYLKIFTKRGPRFSSSQEDIQYIPFQFEPTVGGDSKAAEYAQIATLARSQAAQVYRRSSERNVTLELDYLVANAPSEFDDYVTQAINNGRTSKSAEDMVVWTEDYIYNYVVRNFRNLVLPNIQGTYLRLAPPIVQVWYGGIQEAGPASSVGATALSQSEVADEENIGMRDIHPMFRTNWYGSDGIQRSYRSLWICKNVGFEYKGGIINRSTRNHVWVTVQLQLTEIAPSITDNEVLIWSKIS